MPVDHRPGRSIRPGLALHIWDRTAQQRAMRGKMPHIGVEHARAFPNSRIFEARTGVPRPSPVEILPHALDDSGRGAQTIDRKRTAPGSVLDGAPGAALTSRPTRAQAVEEVSVMWWTSALAAFAALLLFAAEPAAAQYYEKDLAMVNQALKTNPSQVPEEAVEACTSMRDMAIQLNKMGKRDRAERRLKSCKRLLKIGEYR
jgi:hypothetical protein